jgi:hypothetical protein
MALAHYPALRIAIVSPLTVTVTGLAGFFAAAFRAALRASRQGSQIR